MDFKTEDVLLSMGCSSYAQIGNRRSFGPLLALHLFAIHSANWFLGAIALKLRRAMNRRNGFSLIELLIVVAIILIIASIAIPNLLRSKMSANRAAAVSTLRNLHNSQAVYVMEFGGNQIYAGSLLQLGPGTPCNSTHACLVDAFIGCTTEPCAKSGYGYFMTSPAPGTYVSAATPLKWNATGTDNYCSTDTGVIHRQLGASASLSAAPPRADCETPTLYEPIQ